MTPRRELLLIAHSARQLAQSAARGGYRCVVVDLFGDEDTRAAADLCLTVPDFDGDDWLSAVHRIAPAGAHHGVVYGGGMVRPAVLEKLAEGRVLFGNTPAVVRCLKSPRVFFALLDRLGVPYPAIRFEAPESLENWLLKSACDEGGVGVRLPASQETRRAFPSVSCPSRAQKRSAAEFLGVGYQALVDEHEYFQHRLPGPAYSLLFLADGRDIAPIGFNTLWTAGHDPVLPFLFAGAINRAELNASQRASVVDYAARLVGALGMVGLISLDFMLDGAACRVLEINPRPGATLGLYDADFPGGLLRAHVEACEGRLPGVIPSPNAVRAFRVLYAPEAITLPLDQPLPDWCADRPLPGLRIAAGAPLCSIMAAGPGSATTLALLERRQAELLRRLGLRSREYAFTS
jgi:predicted ATP-grasp superfamily ATP-dependent carboligase